MKRTKLTLTRPNGPTERQIAKWALHPKIRSRLSAALRRPIFPNQIYISHGGKYVHIRLASPNKFDKNSFRMKDLGGRGTRGIIGCPRGQWDPVTNSCKVGTRLQAVLIPKPRVTELGRKLNTLSMPKRHRRTMNDNPSNGFFVMHGKGQSVGWYQTREEAEQVAKQMNYRGGANYTVQPDGKVARRKRSENSYESNPLLMTVTNPGPEYGFKPNPVDVEYDPDGQMFKVHRSNPGAGYHSNPENPLTEYELHQLGIREQDNKEKYHAAVAAGKMYRATNYEGRADEDRHFRETYSENPRGRGYDPDDERDYPDDDDDRSEFADPGGKSALRASSPSNPRNLPCPNCGRQNRLTPADIARGYQCDSCADQLERGGYNNNPRHRGSEDEDSSGEMGYGWCKKCSGPLMLMGNLGNRIHLRCRNCGADASRERKETDPTPFENNKSRYCDNPGGFCTNPGHGHANGWFKDNPSFQYEVGDYVINKARIQIGNEIMLEKGRTGKITGKGKYMGENSYEVFYETPRGNRTFRMFERELKFSGKSFGDNRRRKYRRNGPPHYRPRGANVTGRRTVRGTPTTGEYYDRKGQVTGLRKQPSARAGGRVGKSSIKGRKIPIAKFMAWLKRSGTPDEQRRFMKEMIAYKKFHKGAEPKFITRKLVDVGAGRQVIGRAFGYSMGKSPFEPYITPSGSGKGNKTPYLHEYETLPDGITNSTGKVVIKPLEGRTKITDWIHY